MKAGYGGAPLPFPTADGYADAPPYSIPAARPHPAFAGGPYAEKAGYGAPQMPQDAPAPLALPQAPPQRLVRVQRAPGPPMSTGRFVLVSFIVGAVACMVAPFVAFAALLIFYRNRG